MEYKDRVYGTVEINEPIIVDLLKSTALQRLKDVDQAGYFEPHFPNSRYSRFEHSVGVYLLLRQYAAPVEEQVAGLIHDVSHSAFSHCIDYVLDQGSEKKQSHQDTVFDTFVKKSDIPEVIEKYGMEMGYILDDRNFPLKERELPNLCADRIDYSLRTAVVFKEIEEASPFLENLDAEDGRWIFKDFASACEYAQLFLKLNTKYYAGLPSAIMFRTVGDYLRHALSKGYLSESDLYTTYTIVLEKVKQHHEDDPMLRVLFDRMNNSGVANDPDEYDARVFCKSRAVDPLCRQDGNIVKVSDIDPSWGAVVRRESEPKEYFLKFDRYNTAITA